MVRKGKDSVLGKKKAGGNVEPGAPIKKLPFAGKKEDIGFHQRSGSQGGLKGRGGERAGMGKDQKTPEKSTEVKVSRKMGTLQIFGKTLKTRRVYTSAK